MHSTLISWNNAEWHAREHLLVPAHEEKQQHLQLLIRCFITQRRGEERRGYQLSWKQLKASLFWLLLSYWFKSHRNDSLWSHNHVPGKQTDDAGSSTPTFLCQTSPASAYGGKHKSFRFLLLYVFSLHQWDSRCHFTFRWMWACETVEDQFRL